MIEEPPKYIIDGMCMTYRHDFGLDKSESNIIGSGMTESERESLRLTMRQIWTHNIAPYIQQSATPDIEQYKTVLVKARDALNEAMPFIGYNASVPDIVSQAEQAIAQIDSLIGEQHEN